MAPPVGDPRPRMRDPAGRRRPVPRARGRARRRWRIDHRNLLWSPARGGGGGDGRPVSARGAFAIIVDITTEQFYEKIRDPRAKPTTSTPSLGECREVYELAIREGARELLVLTIATELSTTYSVANVTAQQIGDARIEVVDTRSTDGATGLIASACARLRRDGADFDATVALARRLAPNTHLLALIDTLDFLRRSGRISGARALFGSLLAVKP